MTPEQRVAEELARDVWVGYTDEAGDDDGNYGVVDSDGRRTLSKHALNAVRAALNSDDPAVVRAMAERVGLTVETREWVDRELTWDGGWTVIRRYERARVCGPWREVPNAD